MATFPQQLLISRFDYQAKHFDGYKIDRTYFKSSKFKRFLYYELTVLKKLFFTVKMWLESGIHFLPGLSNDRKTQMHEIWRLRLLY